MRAETIVPHREWAHDAVGPVAVVVQQCGLRKIIRLETPLARDPIIYSRESAPILGAAMRTFGLKAEADDVPFGEICERLFRKRPFRLPLGDEVSPILERRAPELKAFLDRLILGSPAPQPACHLVEQLQRVEIGEQMNAP